MRELESIVNCKNSELSVLRAQLEGVCPASLLKESQERFSQMSEHYTATVKLLESRVSETEKELSLTKMA